MDDLSTKQQLLAGAVTLDGDNAWWKAYFGITQCTHCARTEGLSLGLQTRDYVVVKCDCNYQHILPAQRLRQTRLHVVGEPE